MSKDTEQYMKSKEDIQIKILQSGNPENIYQADLGKGDIVEMYCICDEMNITN